jgi:hypothetical protein
MTVNTLGLLIRPTVYEAASAGSLLVSRRCSPWHSIYAHSRITFRIAL